MLGSPMVSICIPSYNAEHFIAEAIQSALNQTYNNIELVICDDVSTDDSWEIIDRFSDNRINKFRNIENLGLVGNFRKVISKSKGKYITFLCNDDILHPDSIRKLVEVLERDVELAFAFGNINYRGNRDGGTNYSFALLFEPGEWIKKSFNKGKNITYLIGTLFRKIEEPPHQTIVDLVFFDWYLWARLGRGKVAFIKDVVGEHRYHSNNQTNQLTPGFLQNYLGLKKVFTLLYHNRLIDKNEFFRVVQKLTVNYSLFFYSSKLYPNDNYLRKTLKGYKFCVKESFTSFQTVFMFVLKGCYLITLNVLNLGKRK